MPIRLTHIAAAILVALSIQQASAHQASGTKTADGKLTSTTEISRTAVFDGGVPWVVSFVVNGRRQNDALAIERKGQWYLPIRELKQWGLRDSIATETNASRVKYRGQDFVLATSLGATDIKFEEVRLVLNLRLPSAAFIGTGNSDISRTLGETAATQQATGGFLNYDLLAYAASGRSVHFASDFQLGAFNSLGSASTTFSVSDVAAISGQPAVRKMTTLRRDWPDKMTTLEIGDSIGKSGIWGRPVLFGGVNYHTNFTTRPGFVTYQLPSFAGEAVIPSTAEVLVNGQPRAAQPLVPGPFSLSNVPVLTGNNEVSFVIRDALGRETVTTQQFYSSPTLLKPGLHDFSIEAGAIRKDFGLRSFGYSRNVLVAQSRYGFSEKLTTEFRGEVVGRAITLGAGATYVVPIPALATGAVVVSNNRGKSGYSAVLGLEKVEQNWGAGARAEVYSADFTQLGYNESSRPPKWQASAFFRSKLGPRNSLGTLAFAYVQALKRDGLRERFATASWTYTTVGQVTFQLLATHNQSDLRRSSVGLLLSMPIGPRINISSAITKNFNADTVATLEARLALPDEPGIGWHVRTQYGTAVDNQPANSLVDAGATWRTSKFDVTGNVGGQRGSQYAQLGISGAFGVAHGRMFAARYIDGGFGVVSTSSIPNVPITMNNRVVAITDSDGFAVLPRLIPYERNMARINMKQLPLGIDTDTHQIELVPAYGSAAFGEFKVFRSVSAIATIRLANGEPVARGAEAIRAGAPTSYVVGSGGRLFMDRLQPTNRITVTYEGGSCRFELALPPAKTDAKTDTAGALIKLGDYVCAEIPAQEKDNEKP